MDAIEFIKERDRMFEVAGYAPSLIYKHEKSAEEIVREVDEWAAAHPIKTHQSVFLEHHPNARLDSEGVICICPETVYGDEVKALCVKSKMCHDCRHKFWPQEVKE